MSESESWTAEIFGILPHPATHRVLMLGREPGWALPGTQVDGKRRLTPEPATRELRKATGLPVIAIRFARITKDDARRDREGIFVLDAIGPLPVPPDTGRGHGRSALSPSMPN